MSTGSTGQLQNLRDFTVQIRTPDHQAIVGTGIVVAANGLVVTCLHVAQAACAHDGPVSVGDEVGVYFPRAVEEEARKRQATVYGVLQGYDDDAVLLKVQGDSLPVAEDQIAVLGAAELSEGHTFRSYGYPGLDKYLAAYAEGKIRGQVDRPAGYRLQCEPLQLKSSEIDRGMSGSAVLDVERNLVVGIVTETYIPSRSTKHRDTAWAVDAAILSLSPFNLPLRDSPLPRSSARQPQTDVTEARASVELQSRLALHGASAPLATWVGREQLLTDLESDWRRQRARVVGLIGFGGSGKSSLARKWVDAVVHSPRPPSGIFWWSFSAQPSVDAFLEAALRYLSSDRIDPQRLSGANIRVQVIASMLGAAPVIFVLDGLEELQDPLPDDPGALQNPDLREFLELLAGTDHKSMCVITSRLPVVDLIAYPAYRQREVEALTVEESRGLLRKLGVTGRSQTLDRIVTAWGGHALTLSLIGSHLAQSFGGKVSEADALPQPQIGDDRYDRLQKMLAHYDSHLTDAQRLALAIFSAFRLPVPQAAFAAVFRASPEVLKGQKKPKRHKKRAAAQAAFNAPLTALSDRAFSSLINRLVASSLVRRDAANKTYSLHPLVRLHYAGSLDRRAARLLHRRIASFYLEQAGALSERPTLEELGPLIEAVHHSCQSREYGKALTIYWRQILQGQRYVLTAELGAYETSLALMREFFPDGDVSRDCLVRDDKGRRRIMRETGFALMALGQPKEAQAMYLRLTAADLKAKSWHEASLAYQDLSRLNAALGLLDDAEAAAAQAWRWARRARSGTSTRNALVMRGWVAHLRGDAASATSDFRHAADLMARIEPDTRFLDGMKGALYAEHLWRSGDADRARQIAEYNQTISEARHHAYNLSRFHRILGHLDADAGETDRARAHFDAAVDYARSTSDRVTLINALLSRGHFLARVAKDAVSARRDLDETIGYVRSGGFHLHEVDARVLLTWVHLAEGNTDAARGEAEAAKDVSVELGYHWGKVDAEVVLDAIRFHEGDAT